MNRCRWSSQPKRSSRLAPGLFLFCAACATVTEEDPPSTLEPSASAAGAASAPASGGGSANGGTGNVGLGGSFNNGPSGSTSPAAAGARPPVGAGGASGGINSAGSSSAGSSSAGSSSAGSSSAGTPPVVDTTPQFPSGTSLLEEDFEAFQQADWLTSEGSQWAITTHSEAEGNVYGQTADGPSTPQLVTSGNTSWRGVVAEVDFNVVSFNGSSSGYMAGLCLRVQDADTFYMVGLRSGTGQIQLRAFGDSDTNLTQSDFAGGVVGVWYHLKVEIVGSTITAYLDDELMFTHTDAAIPTGGIGLCTVRASALFDNVRVTAP